MQSPPFSHPTKLPPFSCNTYAGTTGVGFRGDLELQVTSAPKPAGSPRPAIKNAKRVAERSVCGSATGTGSSAESEAWGPGRTAPGTPGAQGRERPLVGPRWQCGLLATAPARWPPPSPAAGSGGERGRAGTAAGTRPQRARAGPLRQLPRGGERAAAREAAAAAAAATRKRGEGCRARANAAAAAGDSPEVGSQ